MGALSFLAANWLMIVPALVVAAGFGYIAFMLKNWRAAAAAAGIVAVLVGAGVIWKRGYDARQAEVVAAQQRTIAARETTIAELQAADQKRAEADAALIAELQRQIDETPTNDTPAIDKETAHRIGGVR